MNLSKRELPSDILDQIGYAMNNQQEQFQRVPTTETQMLK